MDPFETRRGVEFLELVPSILRNICREMKRSNDLKEQEQIFLKNAVENKTVNNTEDNNK